MPKFKVLLQQYVEKVAEVEIEADTYQEAIDEALTNGAAKATWEDGDDAYSVTAYAAKLGDEIVWER